MNLLYSIFVFGFGLVFGSFLNVCIQRMPEDKSIVFPGSHCPKCKKPIRWQDNIPVFSWILLKGKCRDCGERIAFRYPMVELANAILWLLLFQKYGFTSFFFAGIVYFSILLAVTMTDLETGLIPDFLSLPGIVLGIIFSTVWPELQNAANPLKGLIASLLGVLAGGGVLYAMGMLGNWLFKKESMGGGDIKLLAMIGAFLGPFDAFLMLPLSAIISMPIALYARFFKKAETIPFGPFLALAGAWVFLYGDTMAKHFPLFNW